MSEEKDDNIYLRGKIAKFPKNTKAASAYNYLEKIKISKQKLWYVIIENQNNDNDEIKMIKYNNKRGVNLKLFVEDLKSYYHQNEIIREYIDQLEISGDDKFSIIKNIPNVEINDKKFISIIIEDLMKLLK